MNLKLLTTLIFDRLLLFQVLDTFAISLYALSNGTGIIAIEDEDLEAEYLDPSARCGSWMCLNN